MVAGGFTLIFGLLRIVNPAHGALCLFGDYFGYAVGMKSGCVALARGIIALSLATRKPLGMATLAG